MRSWEQRHAAVSRLLASGDPLRALRRARPLWAQAQRFPEPAPRRRQAAVLLLSALVAAGRQEELAEVGPGLALACSPEAPTLEALGRAVLLRSRRDVAALRVLVLLVEAGRPRDRGLRRAVLRYLAASLDPSGPEGEGLPKSARHDLLERLHRARPHLVFPLVHRGRARYRARDFGGARELLDLISGPLSRSPHLLTLRARCAEKCGDHDAALDLYRLSLAEDRRQAHVHFRIGRLLLHRHLTGPRADF